MATKKAEIESIATGRRKTAIARVRLTKGSGQIVVNDRKFEDYFATTDLRLIVEEACSNVMHHAYPDRPAGELTLELERTMWQGHAAIRVAILDQGMPFNPLARADPDVAAPLAERPIGGLGVMLMRRLSDVQHYGYDPVRGNCLTLVKYLGSAGPRVAHPR